MWVCKIYTLDAYRKCRGVLGIYQCTILELQDIEPSGVHDSEVDLLSLKECLAHRVCSEKKAKLLVFCDWPLTPWNVEMHLINLGSRVIDIRSARKLSESEAAVARFNDPNDDVQILVTSLNPKGHKAPQDQDL